LTSTKTAERIHRDLSTVRHAAAPAVVANTCRLDDRDQREACSCPAVR
jgi:hypothetical protein